MSQPLSDRTSAAAERVQSTDSVRGPCDAAVVSPAPARARARAASSDASPPPHLTLVVGPEEVLVERAVDEAVRRVRRAHEEVEVTDVSLSGVEPGVINAAMSPSLFASTTLVVARGAQDAPEDTLVELADACAAIAGGDLEGVYLVLTHRGGVRGKRVLDAARKAGAVEVACKELKYDSDKLRFVEREFSVARRRATGDAVRALVDACGNDLRELAAAVSQMLVVSDGEITAELVDRYHGGRVEATGFKVADAAIEGRCAEALTMLRHALATGTDPVPVNAAIGAGLRALVKVAAARRSASPEELARELKMAPFQVKKARGQLRGWTGDGIATAISAVAWADAQIKGGGVDPLYALERTVVTVATARGA